MLSILAVGGHVPWQTVLAAYGLTQLAAVLPLTPGGIGVIEGTLSLLLIASHVPAPTAVAAVILYRLSASGCCCRSAGRVWPRCSRSSAAASAQSRSAGGRTATPAAARLAFASATV